jgi:hypothetical protein
MQLNFLYPDNPGWQRTATSRAAAVQVKPTKSLDHRRVLDALEEAPDGLTADEIAAIYGEVFNKFRPRCSELRLHGKIEETGSIRPSYLGNQQIVWRLK